MSDLHDIPAISSDSGKLHVMDRTCWCEPEVMRMMDGDDLIVHNEIEWMEEGEIENGDTA